MLDWLTDKCNEHNSKLSYIDQEDFWTPLEFILSLMCYILLGIFVTIVTYLNIGNFNIAYILVDIVYSVVIIALHFWDLLH